MSTLPPKTWNDEIDNIDEGETREKSLEDLRREGEQRIIEALRVAKDFKERVSNEKAVRRDAVRAKKMQNFEGKLPPGQNTKDARIVEEAWHQETRAYRAEFPAWDGIKRSRVGKIIAKFGVKKTVRIFRYACRCWPQISRRMLKEQSPVPSLDFILKVSDTFFSESSIWEEFDKVKSEIDGFRRMHPDAADLPEELLEKMAALGTGYQQLGLSF
jgi:hypothetical protein